MNPSPIYWVLLVAVAFGVLAFLYREYQSALLRTEVSSVPGGLRFSARLFTVEARRPENTVHITCLNGHCKREPLAGGAERSTTGALDLALPAAGMRIQVIQVVVLNGAAAPKPTGFSSIVFKASDEMTFNSQGKDGGQRSTVQLHRVPDAVASTFNHFSNGLQAWFEQLEHDLAAGLAARQAQATMEAAEEAARQALAAGTESAAQTPKSPLSAAEQEVKAKAQLNQWRQKAGFSGKVTDMRFDSMGEIDWLIDLNADGRVILHSAQRHFHGSLNGAVVSVQADELRVMVRDEYWEEGDDKMPTFRLFKGASRDVLLTWQKRLGEAMERFQIGTERR